MASDVAPELPAATAAGPSHTSFARIMHRDRLLAVRARYRRSGFGSSGPYVAETFGCTPSFLCVVQLHEFPPTQGWRDGRHFLMPVLPAGSAHVLDLRHEWRTDAPHPFDNVHLNITQAALDELADEHGLGRVDITAPPPFGASDATLRDLGLLLVPAFRRPSELNALFADHIISAAAIHLAEAYGGVSPTATRIQGGLAPWQERRARDMLMAHLTDNIGLVAVASACGLSSTHFGKAFRQTVGLPPHRWLLNQRVARAREMLLATNEPLDAIALACGFADQSHLNRVFSKAVGLAPGAWRRIRRS